MENQIIHDKAAKKFVLKVNDGGEAFIDYQEKDGVLHLVYSEVPEVYRGKGIGKELVLKTFDLLTKEGYKAKAVCGYVNAVRQRSEDWKDIIE
ncbi:hypothetical protein SAMN05216474_2294 [Lishizhenia tianjinensis]|uniref:N-acetyltransferase domain-containing protein n=1 Tax=Lishizhenia tianjinensis TaxID=477690 RepID=A0A1I7APM5_9FLAO|nr:GNAT family N-acetyltransferase [Lishizhenia tianjinensis]SFT76901.1 hypothetical protein SAMN05216474_2294 [Lishizhenia tianjinensis]